MNLRVVFAAPLFLAFATASICQAQPPATQQPAQQQQQLRQQLQQPAASQGAVAQQGSELTPDQQALRTEIRKLMELTGQAEMGRQVMGQMIGMFQQQNPNVPAEFWENFMKEVDANEMIEMIIPIYERHFTKEDITGMIRFYQSPVGQKMLSAQPQIMQESFVVGQQWGQKLAERAMQRMQEEGF